ncbi:MAG: BlaI/MecI/CopY family transcriptional regulator [Phycisphaerae bacterium]|nr:BlaI/MecI/CopY family transcriptional regulator [Gemmatimonadaceae bacterium]
MGIVLTDRELDIMTVLWEQGPSTASEVREHLTDELAYNTVLTMLRILEEKGYAGRTPEGRAHRYHAMVERELAGRNALKRLVDGLFGGSAELLLTNLVKDRKMKRADIERLRKALDDRLDEESSR